LLAATGERFRRTQQDHDPLPSARHHQRSGASAQARPPPVATTGWRVACLSGRFGLPDRRPPVVEPRHGRT